jgi:hypothetical protein
MAFLEGKKTYLAAALMALGAIGAFMAGQIDGQMCFQNIMAAAGFAGLRAAK